MSVAAPVAIDPAHRGVSSWAGRALVAVALIWLLREAQPVLAPVFTAVVLTFVLAPVVRWLRRFGIREAMGAAIVIALLLGSVVPVTAFLAEPAASWWERAPATWAGLMRNMDHVRAAIPGFEPPPAPRPRAATPPPADPVKAQIASQGVALTGALLGRGAAFLVSASATLILLYLLLASEHWMLSRSVEAVPRRRIRALVLGGIRAAQREIARYLSSLALINVGVTAVVALAMQAVGLPNPFLWGVIAGVLNFVPYIGPLVMAALLLAAGAVSFGEPAEMIEPALAFAVIHAIESNFVSMWFVGRRLSLSRISVFLSVMLWGWLWGIGGALIAVPILICVRCICRRNRRLRLLCIYLDGDIEPPRSLRSLLRRPAAPLVAPARRKRGA